MLIVSCVFMMLCVFFYCLNSGISDNKHELIQVIAPANVTTHKSILGQVQAFEHVFRLTFLHICL